MSDGLVTLRSDALTVAVNPLGAELWSIVDRSGAEWMTDADPAFWTGHAPLLFPIVGALAGDRYRLDGTTYAMAKHGFARKSRFEVVTAGAAAARFRLVDSDATRATYPFAFALDLDYALAGLTLGVTATVTNRDARAMPFSFGFHPAFAWPLPGGAAKDAHRITFAEPEPEPIRRIDPPSGLLLPDAQPTPVAGRELAPTAALFEPDALIWDAPHSRACRFGAPGGGSVALAWDSLPMLGVWQKPGAAYLCIEPWQGIADPVGFADDFRGKPGVIELAPGAAQSFRLAITIEPA